MSATKVCTHKVDLTDIFILMIDKLHSNKANFYAIFTLIAVPTVFFTVYLIKGTPIMPGDDLIQNFPLRLLSGLDIKSGHLPLWNPYNATGSPLLAGFNAGSLYPGTFLFAFLPATTAWTLNLILPYSIAGIGTFALLKHLRCNTFSSFIGAITFEFFGQMSLQIPHVDMIQSLSYLPLILFAYDQLTAKGQFIKYSLILSSLLGLILLTGSTRGVTDIFIVLLIVVIFSFRPTSLNSTSTAFFTVKSEMRKKVVLSLFLTVIVCILLGLAQLYPGFSYLHNSQRTSITQQFFNEDALPLAWTPLLILPGIFGANHSFGTPGFVGFLTTNLPEIGGYTGIIGVCAFIYYLFSRKRKPEINLFLIITILGLILSFGTETPIGSLLRHIPIYGQQRLQGRNLFEFDFGIAILTGYFINELFNASKKISLRPIVIFLLLVETFGVVYLLFPIQVIEHLSITSSLAVNGTRLRWAVLFDLLLVASFLVFFINLKKIVEKLVPIVLILIFIDLLFFTVMISGSFDSKAVFGPNNITSQALNVKSTNQPNSRSIIYSPNLDYIDNLVSIGWPDLNILDNNLSANSYGSLLPEPYADVTGVHGNVLMNLNILQNGVSDSLDISTFYTAPSYFSQLLTPSEFNHMQALSSSFMDSSGSNAPQYILNGTESVSNGIFLGPPTEISSILVPLKQPSNNGPMPQIGLITTKRTYVIPKEETSVFGRFLKVTIQSSLPAVGIYAVRSKSSSPTYLNSLLSFQGTVITDNLKNMYLVGGPVVANLTPISWHFAKQVGQYLEFKRNASLSPVTSTSAVEDNLNVTKFGIKRDGTTTFDISSTSDQTVLVSNAYYAGFKATLRSISANKSISETPRSSGLIMSLFIPKGNWSVTITYSPSKVPIYISAVSWAGVIIIAMWMSRKMILGLRSSSAHPK